MEFEKNTFSKRLSSMLKVDFRRMFGTRLFYIMAAICLLMPVLTLVMTAMNSADAFVNVWQIIGTMNSAEQSSGMDMSAMMNINLVYAGLAVLVCLFVSDDFKSGYSKNLFTVRAKKGDYIASKTIVCFIAGGLLVLAFFIGAVIGGAAAGLSFELGTLSVGNVVMCILSKIFLCGVLVPIFLAISVSARKMTWLSISASAFAFMVLFMMIPMITPLNAGIMNVILCVGGGAIFSVAIGAVGSLILRKGNLV